MTGSRLQSKAKAFVTISGKLLFHTWSTPDFLTSTATSWAAEFWALLANTHSQVCCEFAKEIKSCRVLLQEDIDPSVEFISLTIDLESLSKIVRINYTYLSLSEDRTILLLKFVHADFCLAYVEATMTLVETEGVVHIDSL
jgi:hypothetical protein